MGKAIKAGDEELKRATHMKVCSELTDTYIKKNHDYGDAFAVTYDKLGIISAVTRITDKTNRLVSLCTKEQRVADETLEDTLLDLANYAIMTVMEMRKGQKGALNGEKDGSEE